MALVGCYAEFGITSAKIRSLFRYTALEWGSITDA